MPGVAECQDCGAGNPQWARFCATCGSGLGGRCEHCQAPLLHGSRFCQACGAPVTAGEGRDQEIDVLPEERRIATILFADLTGFTAVSEQADPELVKSIVDRCLRRLGEEVTNHGGRVDKYIGDNVMGVFGAPEAHEDDPERGVRAGLAMQTAMAELNADSSTAPDFALRVGINTGEVMAGRTGGAYTVIGSAVNIAARLQEACQPGEVLVGEATWRRTRERIAYRAWDPIRLRGLSRAEPAFEAVGPTSSEGRRRIYAGAPLVGRTSEIEMLMSAVAAAGEDQNPHLATVLGPPGIGKSRVFAELESNLERSPNPPKVLKGHCPSYGLGASYGAFREVIGSAFDIDPAEPDANPKPATECLSDELERLLSAAETYSDESPERVSSRLASMLGLGPADEAADGKQDPGLQRDQLFAAMGTAVEALASEGTLVIGIENLQWADEGTLDLIEYLTRWVEAPVVIVCMAREELVDRRPDWGSGRRRATTTRLNPLDEDGAARLVAALLGEKGAHELVPPLAARCEGNPLFAEEMVNEVLEQGPDAVANLPETVQAVIDTRLDSLAQGERRLIHHAAVIGDRFWDRSLERYADERGIDLDDALGRLLELDLIGLSATSRLPGSREFRFRHALIQEVAYSRLPKAERARKHAELAAFLEGYGEAMIAMRARHLLAAFRAGQEAQLGSEFTAGAGQAARRSLEAAGDAAAAVYANGEAGDYYESALGIEGAAPPERARLLEKVGDIYLRGGRAAEAAEAWSHCLRLADEADSDAEYPARLNRKLGAADRQRGDREAAIDHVRAGIDRLRNSQEASLELAKLYGDAATLYMGTGENLLAIYAAEKSLTLAELLGDPASASRAYSTFGQVFGRIGDEAKARDNLERAVDRARESEPADLVRALLTFGSHLEAAERDLGRALAIYEEALELARQLGSVPDQIELHGGIARLALRRGDRPRAREATEAGAALAERGGLSGLACFSRLTRGWIQWCAAESEGIDNLRGAEDLARTIGRMDVVFRALMLQGWVLFTAREFNAAEDAFAAALSVCERTGLLAQSVEVSAARAINLARDGGDPEVARRAAAEASATAERLGTDLASTATLEAWGATDPDPVAAAAALEQAARGWAELDRPFATARAEILRGLRLLERDAQAGAAALAAAADHGTSLGLSPLAHEAEQLARAADASRAD